MVIQLKLYHRLLPLIFLPLCGLIMIYFGWMGYATISERPGLNGDWYYYYNLTRPQFYLYNFTVALIALGLGIFQIKFLVDKNPKFLTRTFLLFVLFIGLLIIAEIYLSTRLVGKG